ncbi:hypothetical protein [Nocardioides sp. zg-DK7169]|uniref:hypothetical protein n=1 Tax=Nocardioides sp. zg-DK7169 TaxID=2736600 RepID=UPI001557161F|nr:hypothetical protein [Nocardioides sp. zg-DK7169]NPC96610.1 hypothetical protein [Nocardioides sp. zg-DK7169]
MAKTPATHDYDTGGDPAHAAFPSAAFRASIRAGRYPVIPEQLRAALNARETLETALQNLYASAPARGGEAQQLLAALRNGGELEEALSAAVDTSLEHDRRDIAARILQRAQESAEDHLPQAITNALPEIFAGLRARLDEVAGILRQAYADAGDLDIHAPDPLVVAQATSKQQKALVTIAHQTREYRLIRNGQRDALASSSLRIPGDSDFRVGYRWQDFFETGLHEVSAPGPGGLPGKGMPARKAVRAVVSREDLWLPDPEDMYAAYERLQSTLAAEKEAAAAAALDGPTEPQMGTWDPGTAAFLDAGARNGRRSSR